MKLLTFLLRMSRGTIVLSILIGIIAGASGAGLIALINTRLTDGEFGPMSLTWAFVLLVGLVLVSNIASQLLSTHLAQTTIFDMRMRMCRRILAAPLRQLEEVGNHRLLATLTEDVPAVTAALLNIPSLCINVATLAVSLIYLGWLSRTLLVGMLVFTLLGTVIYQLLVMRALRSIKLARKEQNSLIGHYRAMTEGAKELKLHRGRRKAFLAESLEGTARTLRRHIVTGNTVYTVAGSWSTLLFYIFIGLILFALPSIEKVSAQTLTGYTLTVLYVLGPLAGILGTLPNLGRARISLQQVDELGLSLAARAERDSEPAAYKATDWRELRLINITHSYYREREDSNFTLGPLNLTFRVGELTFLVGGNGSGKTTLAKLLTGLYVPESGEIRLGDEVMTEESRERYRQQFSVVFSDFYLFDTLLGLVNPDLDALAQEYLVKLQLSHKVRISNGELSTTALSFGQRKRLALLTAYLEDRPFYVFDEWAAGQDPVFKDLFYTKLLPELKSRNKTVLVISHDDKYFHLADRVIKLDSGRLASESEVSPSEAETIYGAFCETAL